jgi:hypothetical protein
MLTDATAAATEAFGIFSALESGVDKTRMLLAAGWIDGAAAFAGRNTRRRAEEIWRECTACGIAPGNRKCDICLTSI